MPGLKPAAEVVERWRLARAERRLWSQAPSVEHLRELMAWFCEGELSGWPGHPGPRAEETSEIAPALAAANRHGLLTTGSQPGCLNHNGDGWDQRPAVDGLATADTVAKLRRLVAGTRLQLIVHETPARWRANYDRAVLVTRENGEERTGFGAQLTERQIDSMFSGVNPEVAAQLVEMRQVTIVDPEWGDHDLLWRRLSEPDWDNPPPPPAPEATPPQSPASRTTTPNSSSTGAGTAMTSITDVRAGIAVAVDYAQQSMGALQQAFADLEQAQGALMHAVDGSGQADVSEAVAMLARAVENVAETQQIVAAAVQSAESIGARL